MTPHTLDIVVISGFVVAFTTLFVAGYLRQQTIAERESYIMNWGTLVKQILPIALQFVPGLPPAVATSIIGTIISVESMPGKSGAEKKAIVMNAAVTQLQNINVVKGHDVVNVEVVAEAVDTGIDAGIAAVNAIHKAKVEQPVAPTPILGSFNSTSGQGQLQSPEPQATGLGSVDGTRRTPSDE